MPPRRRPLRGRQWERRWIRGQRWRTRTAAGTKDPWPVENASTVHVPGIDVRTGQVILVNQVRPQSLLHKAWCGVVKHDCHSALQTMRGLAAPTAVRNAGPAGSYLRTDGVLAQPASHRRGRDDSGAAGYGELQDGKSAVEHRRWRRRHGLLVAPKRYFYGLMMVAACPARARARWARDRTGILFRPACDS